MCILCLVLCIWYFLLCYLLLGMVFSLQLASHWWPWWPQVGTPSLATSFSYLFTSFSKLFTSISYLLTLSLFLLPLYLSLPPSLTSLLQLSLNMIISYLLPSYLPQVTLTLSSYYTPFLNPQNYFVCIMQTEEPLGPICEIESKDLPDQSLSQSGQVSDTYCSTEGERAILTFQSVWINTFLSQWCPWFFGIFHWDSNHQSVWKSFAFWETTWIFVTFLDALHAFWKYAIWRL